MPDFSLPSLVARQMRSAARYWYFPLMHYGRASPGSDALIVSHNMSPLSALRVHLAPPKRVGRRIERRVSVDSERCIDKPSRRHAKLQLETAPVIAHSYECVLLANHNWRINMISFIASKTLGRRLMLISAVTLLHVNGALAAELVGGAEMQARDLLSGTVGGRAKIVDVSTAIPADGRHAFNPDPQQQARQMILGKPNLAGIAGRAVGFDAKTKLTTVVSVRGIRRSDDADGQESARRMLLGARG
jgi:hypothetical protein